ncbi:MAG TPA: HEAT repeat domain-containing protein [Burkholderiales bacterium]|nr:HEAT repeat domain-containing protein [Burkholderiales bacterium]
MRFFAALSSLVVATGLLGQTDGFPELMHEQRDNKVYTVTTGRALELHGYALTRESLVRALRDPDAQVRSMAADELAKRGDKEAAPSILEALSSEKAIGTRVWMANALLKLGVAEGTSELRAICGPTTASYYPRLVAAGDLLGAGDATCRDQVIDMVRSMSTLESTLRESLLVYGLTLFTGRFAPMFQPKAAEVREVATTLLADKVRGVRMAASNALGEHGDAASLQALQEAAEAETEDVVRVRMLTNVKILQDKARLPAEGKE